MTFKLEGNLQKNLAGMKQRQMMAVYAAAKYAANEGESFMKSEAPWTDRTGNARGGLRTTVQRSSNKVAIVFYHSVDYGLWLEIRWGGKYGIIPAAMAATGPFFLETLSKLMFEETP